MIIITGLNAKGKNEFYEDYCSPKNTTTANAVFSVLIFLSHSCQHIAVNSAIDEPYLAIRTFLGQSVVVTYLFYSGYGIMESIQRKKIDYVKGIPFNRFFKLWYHFALMICMFIVICFIMGKDYTFTDYLLAFTGYKSIGNDNWYLFVTFALYIIVYLSFIVFRKSNLIAVASVFILTIGFIFIEKELELPPRYYDTIMCFPLGMIFSLIKPYVDKILMKNDIIWLGAVTVVFIACMYCSQNRYEDFIFRVLFMCTSPILITLLMMKLQCRSSILDWFGNHIFSFFMLQRIPMRLLDHFNLNNEPYLFIGMAFFGTILIATVFDEITDRLDKIIFKKKIKA